MSIPFDNNAAVERYASCNEKTLRWMLGRPSLGPGFLNTKMNSITLENYTNDDGLRGPEYTYGWIQGRGLEAIATHAAHYSKSDPALAAQLDKVGNRLYQILNALHTQNGHAFFCYNADMAPVRQADANTIVLQTRPEDIYTYSDAFTAKGLVAAAARYAPQDLPDQLSYLSQVVQAVRDGRFQIDERAALQFDALAVQKNDFGPRMILLGACGLLERIGHCDHAVFGRDFVQHILDHHYDSASGLLRNVPGGDTCNVGHGIEFVGFSLDYRELAPDQAMVELLADILVSSFTAGFVEPGIALSVSASTGAVLNPLCPWWSLPETIRAAALAVLVTNNPEVLSIWNTAHSAFFDHYWRDEASIAYQTREANEPVDYVPATPDLDPGYHTALSFLAAIKASSPQFNNIGR